MSSFEALSFGCRGAQWSVLENRRKEILSNFSRTVWNDWPKKVIALYAKWLDAFRLSTPSITRSVEPREKLGEPSPKAKYLQATDSEQVP